tara:strand:- start:1658 stop:1858 length:201 start_codon:yes stop_codon:yes gene_type:complete
MSSTKPLKNTMKKSPLKMATAVATTVARATKGVKTAVKKNTVPGAIKKGAPAKPTPPIVQMKNYKK